MSIVLSWAILFKANIIPLLDYYELPGWSPLPVSPSPQPMLCRGAQINIRLQDTDTQGYFSPNPGKQRQWPAISPLTDSYYQYCAVFLFDLLSVYAQFFKFLTKLRRINLPLYNLFLWSDISIPTSFWCLPLGSSQSFLEAHSNFLHDLSPCLRHTDQVQGTRQD